MKNAAGIERSFKSQVSELWAKQREEMLAAAQKNKVYNITRHKLVFSKPIPNANLSSQGLTWRYVHTTFDSSGRSSEACR